MKKRIKKKYNPYRINRFNERVYVDKTDRLITHKRDVPITEVTKLAVKHTMTSENFHLWYNSKSRLHCKHTDPHRRVMLPNNMKASIISMNYTSNTIWAHEAYLKETMRSKKIFKVKGDDYSDLLETMKFIKLIMDGESK